MEITRVSMLTDKERTQEIPVTQEQLDNWRGGTLIQHAMPNLTDDQREFLMTGITPEEWDEIFGEEES